MTEEVLALRAKVLGAVEASTAIKAMKGQIDLFGKTDAMRKVNADLSNLNRQFGSVSAIAGTATGSILAAGTGALTAAASMAKFVNSMNDLQARVTDLKFLSDQTGVAADKIDQLSIAAKKLGVAPEAISAAFSKMSRESIDITRNTSSLLGEIRAAEGGKYANFADQLRKDGRDVQKLVSDTLKFLSQIPDGEKRAVWAEKLLGSSELAKLFPKGSDTDFNKAMAEAYRDPSQAEKMRKMAEQYRRAKADLDTDLDDFTKRVAPKYFEAASGLIKRLGKFLNPDEAAVSKKQAAGGAREELEALIGPARQRLQAYEKAHPDDKSSFEYKMLKGNLDNLETRVAKAAKEGIKEGAIEGLKGFGRPGRGNADPRFDTLKPAPMSFTPGAGPLGAAPGTPRIWQANWGGGDVRGGYGYGGVAPHGGGDDDGPAIHTPAGPRRIDGPAARGMGRIRRGLGRRTGGGGGVPEVNANFSKNNADAVRQAAKMLGTSPEDLATVIGYETRGTYNPNIWGGAKRSPDGHYAEKGHAGDFLGLIQFGHGERAMYGAHEGQTFAEQMKAVVKYLKHRGLKPGMGLMDLYSTINAGRPGRYGASDGYGTVATHTDRMKRERRAGALRFLASGTPGPIVDAELIKPPVATPAKPLVEGETPLARFRRQLRELDAKGAKPKPPGTPEEHRKMFMQSAAQTRHDEAVAQLHGRRAAFARPLRAQRPQEHRVDTSGKVDMTLSLKGLPQGSRVSSATTTDGIMGGVRVISNGSHMPVASNR